jgi:hypothetical protein
MPYFYSEKNNYNMLFIHIPKTGGTSIEQYFANKLGIRKLTEVHYYTVNVKLFYKGVSLQHQTLQTIKEDPFFKINWENIKIISCVRNPYNRIVSEIHYRIRTHFKEKQHITDTIKNLFIQYKKNNIINDNHIRPQYEFLCDKEGKLYDNIIIMKTENLKEMMKENEWDDFDLHVNKSISYKIEDCLNKESIELINDFYSKDFEYFGYDKINNIE